MAEEEMVEKKKKSRTIMMVVLVIVGLAMVGGVSYAVTTKVMTNSVSKAAPARDPGIFVKLGDAKNGIIVNVGGVKSGKFLKAGIVLEMNPKKEDIFVDGKITTAAETKILDLVTQELRSQNIDGFEPQRQDELKKKLKDEINKQLGEGSVYEVYITNFMFQ